MLEVALSIALVVLLCVLVFGLLGGSDDEEQEGVEGRWVERSTPPRPLWVRFGALGVAAVAAIVFLVLDISLPITAASVLLIGIACKSGLGSYEARRDVRFDLAFAASLDLSLIHI